MFRTSNPALRESTFRVRALPGQDVMTVQGTVNKTGLSLLVLVAAAAFSWSAGPAAGLLAIAGLAGGLVFALCTIFKNTWAPVTTPLYAACEGLLLGAISYVFNAQYPGIAFNAVALTMGTLAVMLVAYSSGLVRATERFKLGVIAATGAIAALYLVSMVMGFFGARIPGIFDSGAVGVAFSLFVVVIAALNLVLDFDFIERGAAGGAPRYMEWVGAFGLLVTLVWLYLEILRLLAKLQGRNRR